MRQWTRQRLTLGCLAAVMVLLSSSFSGVVSAAEPNAWQKLGEQVQPMLACLNGKTPSYQLTVELEVEIQNSPQQIRLELLRYDAEAFDFRATHADFAVEVARRGEQTVMTLPLHKRQFVGTGPVPQQDRLLPTELPGSLVDSDSQVSLWLPLLKSGPQAWALLLTPLNVLSYDAEAREWTVTKNITLRPAANAAAAAWGMDVAGPNFDATLRLSSPQLQAGSALRDEFEQVTLERDELERQLSRGLRRALAILAPAPRLTAPAQKAIDVEHGSLEWVEGQRLVRLWGTPEQLGQAHAQLLRPEAIRCLDSVLHTFGTVQTIRTGRWFREDLEAAAARLRPHIPDDHLREQRALALELGWDPQLVQTLNVFPELFHCSGFAVFDAATKDGVLYHGRVLDYMTTIGLQDAATTFVVAPEGKIAFANVGYGGFCGSVSGMNAAGISLGEMGGRGEGAWDGVPMATLMRRALEECRTLDEVVALWKNNPRTCEYYYVFADGNARRAVGVAATPENLELVEPGAFHELLGPGISDAVVLSAGDRLKTLRQRVQEHHGKIDANTAMWLMSRPVAMTSNLHNVLFVPEQGVFYVANATHQQPAAERPYVKFNLQEALQKIEQRQPATEAP